MLRQRYQSRTVGPALVAGRALLFVGAPLALAGACIAQSIYLNVCPLTQVHYGVVTNADPVPMLAPNLRLPGGCCPPQVIRAKAASGDEDMDLPVTVSVPCLVPAGAEHSNHGPPR